MEEKPCLLSVWTGMTLDHHTSSTSEAKHRSLSHRLRLFGQRHYQRSQVCTFLPNQKSYKKKKRDLESVNLDILKEITWKFYFSLNESKMYWE